MASEYKGLYVEFEGNSTKLTAALADINSASRKSQSALRGVQNALKLDPSSTKLMGEAMVAARGKVEATTKRVETLKQAQQEAAKETERLNGVEAEGEKQEKALADAKQRLAQDTADVNRKLAEAEAYLKRDQRALVSATNATAGLSVASVKVGELGTAMTNLGSGMSSVGGKLTMGVTMPLVALAAASVSSAVTIDSALTDVRKTTDLTEQQYQDLKQSAIELSETQPVDAATILSLEGLGAQLGWSDDKLQDFATTVSGLDIATDMDAETAATNLAQFANITGMAQDKAENYASAIVGLGNNMATTESKISDMAMGMASAGTQAGMSQADILGVAAAAASLGVDAQAGGSAFSKTINEIGVQVSTNGAQLKNWADLAHMSVDEFKNAWSTDATGTFEAVIQGMGEVEQNGGDLNVTLADLGITELRQSDLLRRMAGNSDLVTRAVGLSNQSWSENSALAGEVGNRNESLASKFEVLKNRVVAVGEQLGGPLADAALAAVDAAKPLTDAIGDAAEAFSSMDEGSQRSIISIGAMAAAAGPLLTIAGKVTGLFGGVVKGVSGVLGVAGQFQAAVGATDAVTRTAMASTGTLANKLGLLSSGATLAEAGLSSFVTGGVLIAIAAVAAYGYSLYDAWQTEQDFNAAVDEMADSADGVSGKLAAGSREVTSWGGSARESAMDTKDLTDAIQNHNDAMDAIKDNANESVSMLGQYQAVVDRLAGSHEASAQDTALLQWALEGLNGALGTSYTAEQVLTGEYEDQSGEIQNVRDEIDKLIEARQREASTKAYQDLYTGALENQIKMQANAKTAQDEYNDALDERNQRIQEYIAQGQSQHDAEETADAFMRQQGGALEDYSTKLDQANDALSSANDELNGYSADMAASTAATGEAGAAISDFINGTEGWADALSDTGFSLDVLAGSVAEAGLSTDQLNAMGSANFAALAASAGGDTQKLIDILKMLDAQGISDKPFTVSDDGTISDEQGNVWDLDAMTINGKPFEVTDDGTIVIARASVQQLSDASIDGKSFTVSAIDNASSVISRIKQLRDALQNKDITITSYNRMVYTTQHVPNAHGGVVAHADGAVYTRPTMIDSKNLIGEAGPEYYDGHYIVPLTSTYGRPLAEMIADGVAERQRAAAAPLDVAALSRAVATEVRSQLSGLALYVDGRRLVGATAEHMSVELARMQSSR